jgi:hypothetical protein
VCSRPREVVAPQRERFGISEQPDRYGFRSRGDLTGAAEHANGEEAEGGAKVRRPSQRPHIRFGDLWRQIADGKALYILTPSLAFRGARDVAQVPCNAAFAMSAAL